MKNHPKLTTVFRGSHEEKFTIFGNALTIHSPLSDSARAILIEILSRPSDWIVLKSQLQKPGRGTHIIDRVFKELQKYGYVSYERFYFEGHIEFGRWIVVERPEELSQAVEASRRQYEEYLENLDQRESEDFKKSLNYDSLEPGKQQLLNIDKTKNREKINKKDKNITSPSSSTTDEAVLNKPKSSKHFHPETEAYQLAQIQLELILDMKPNFQKKKLCSEELKEKKIQSWAIEFDKILRIDEREFLHMLNILDYVYQDDFLKCNILSPDKLRKRLDEVELRMPKHLTEKQFEDNNPELTKKLMRMYGKKFLRNRRFEAKPHDKEKFIKATKTLVSYCKENKRDPNSMVKYLLRSLDDFYASRGQSVMIGHVCSEYTWEQIVPQYLRNSDL